MQVGLGRWVGMGTAILVRAEPFWEARSSGAERYAERTSHPCDMILIWSYIVLPRETYVFSRM